MKTIKIFLASSNELQSERTEFETFINRRNNALVKKGMFLELVIWEDILAALSQTRSQDVYNEALRGCDIFLVLFHTKVGKYTEEEFDAALAHFRQNNKPQIFTYLNTASSEKEIQPSVEKFKQRLSDLGHFYSRYNNNAELINHFRDQFEKLETAGYFGVNDVFSDVKSEIAKGKPIAKILEKHREAIIALDEDREMELTLLQSRGAKLAKDERIGIVTNSDANIERARITNSLLYILDEIKEDME